MRVDKKEVVLKDIKGVYQYVLINDNGMEVKILTLGGIITDIIVPDSRNNLENVVLGWDDFNDYVDDPSYAGAIIGRNSGRILDGKIKIGNKVYNLSKNNGRNTLHGGIEGFNKKNWIPFISNNEDEISLVLESYSLDGEEGFPGSVKLRVEYSLNNENEFTIKNYGISDKDTIYKKIGRDINKDNTQLQIGNGYDHPWVLSKEGGYDISLYDEISGRKMEIYTDRKSVVIYTTNFPENKRLYNGEIVKKNDGICFETQSLPIGENYKFIKDSLLKKDEEYKTYTKFKFYW